MTEIANYPASGGVVGEQKENITKIQTFTPVSQTDCVALGGQDDAVIARRQQPTMN